MRDSTDKTNIPKRQPHFSLSLIINDKRKIANKKTTHPI